MGITKAEESIRQKTKKTKQKMLLGVKRWCCIAPSFTIPAIHGVRNSEDLDEKTGRKNILGLLWEQKTGDEKNAN